MSASANGGRPKMSYTGISAAGGAMVSLSFETGLRGAALMLCMEQEWAK